MKRLREKDGIQDDVNSLYVEFGPDTNNYSSIDQTDPAVSPPITSPEEEISSPTITEASQSNIETSGNKEEDSINIDLNNDSNKHPRNDVNCHEHENISDDINSNFANDSQVHQNENKQKSCTNNNANPSTDRSKITSSISRKKEKIAAFLPNSFPFIKSKNNNEKGSNKDKVNSECNSHKEKSLKKWSNKDKKSIQNKNNQNLESDLIKLNLNK